MLAFAAAVQTATPPQFATVEPVFVITIFIAAATAGYWLGSLSLPRWSQLIAAVVWLAALAALIVALGTHDIECSADPRTRTNALKAWISAPALAIALACPAFIARKLSPKHIIAIPVSVGFAALGLALAIGVAFDWLTRSCSGVVY
ncbi:MAG: hypothetical protein AB7G40_16330 [Hyphomonadaceae bacterium]